MMSLCTAALLTPSATPAGGETGGEAAGSFEARLFFELDLQVRLNPRLPEAVCGVLPATW